MDQSIIRISKELSDIQKGSDLAIAVACRDIDVRHVRALIMGPHETPYEFGFFEIILPDLPMFSALRQTGAVADLTPIFTQAVNTWRGERGEEWSSAQGLESILLSIQSLMSANPYENEPGFENANGITDKQAQKHYIQKIRHETLRISIIQRLEGYLGLQPNGDGAPVVSPPPDKLDCGDLDEDNIPFEPFKDLFKRRFLWYYDSYLAAVLQGKSEVADLVPFVRMPFEALGSNSMEGRFNYTELERRLRAVKGALDAEAQRWAEEGLASKAGESTVAVNLQHQFDRASDHLKRGDMPHNVVLENGNPFVWLITYFGRPMTNLDGGLFRIRMSFSTRFPDEQPRVKFETKIFHHHIAADGTACYTPNPMKMEDVMSHIDAIFETLEEDEPAYDPRKIVNPEATKMFWGSNPDDKKQYNRRLRRSVQQSM
ncbi:hypothetical protein Trco_006427, partial [Trichoderma cornu-damae]